MDSALNSLNLFFYLQDAFGDLALFFCDPYGGTVIAVLWKPKAFMPIPFKVRPKSLILSIKMHKYRSKAFWFLFQKACVFILVIPEREGTWTLHHLLWYLTVNLTCSLEHLLSLGFVSPAEPEGTVGSRFLTVDIKVHIFLS